MRIAGKYLFFSTSLILVILHLGVWIQDNHAFSVKKIVVSGTYLLETEEVLAAANVDSAKSIWDTDIEIIEERLRALPQARDVAVSRLFPSNIHINIYERKPVAVLVGNGLWGVDSEGFLLPRFRSEVGMDFPVITGFRLKKQAPGTQVENPKVLALADLLGHLQESSPVVYNLISEITMNESIGVRALTVEKSLPVYFGKGSLLKKCKKFEAAWEYFASERKLDQIHYLDLRFEDQVVVRKKTKTRTHS